MRFPLWPGHSPEERAIVCAVMVEADVYVGLSRIEVLSVQVGLHNFSYAGLHRYSLTICTSRRQRVFVNREAVDLVLWQLLQSASRSGFAVIAYCFMPDHLHLLVEGTDDHAALNEFARVFKQCSAYHWKSAFGSQLWQRSYFEHVLREGESPVKAARYILANPLRAGTGPPGRRLSVSWISDHVDT